MSSNYIIKSKINSINKTKTITKAMELVSSSKLKKSKIIFNESLYYLNNINRIINNILSTNIQCNHIYLQKKKIDKNIGIIIISSDQGLCGSLNSNILRIILSYMSINKDKNFFFYIVGSKGNKFFSNIENINIQFFQKIKNININNVIDLCIMITNDLKLNKIDKFILFSNNLMMNNNYKVISQVILPLKQKIGQNKNNWDYIYEPNTIIVIDKLFSRYIESKLYCAILENLVCENYARMMSMNNATENAKEMINNLKIEYNKSRQYAITQELSEIIAGTEALQ